MSYLNPPRLHFSGKFQAAVSTVNNDPLHFDNATFIPAYQKMQDATGPNGWWNPDGDAAWRLIGCKVTSAWIGYDEQAGEDDPIRTCLIGDSDRSLPAKLVDLDPEQQLVSEIWGLEVRIALPDGTNLLRSRYETAAFSDIWDRAASGGGDVGAGAMYQSVLTDLEWGDVAASHFLSKLKEAARDGLLSIKFNVDGYNMDFNSPDFTRGRIAGSIGPATAGEPRHFVMGRHFMAAAGPNGNFFAPTGQVNFCVAVVDRQKGRIVLDLGNALPTVVPGGRPVDLGTLALGYAASRTMPPQGTQPTQLEAIDYTGDGWYETTAGIVTLPAHRALTPDELSAIDQGPLALTIGTGADIAIAEAPNGTHVRADRFVFRLNPGDTATARVFASRWGQPYAGASIASVLDPSQLQPGSQLGTAPPVAVPDSAVDFPARVVANRNGVAELAIRVADPGQPRQFIDGQVYGVRPALEDEDAGYNPNPWDFVSLLVWSGFTAEDPPTWHGSMEPIFRQYANLYPVMKPIVDLSSYDSICANVGTLKFVFGLPLENPDYMPVTRDLSDAKRKAILRWLGEPGPDGKPLEGTPQPAMQVAVAAAAPSAAAPTADDTPRRGGKTAAASRRLVLRNQT